MWTRRHLLKAAAAAALVAGCEDAPDPLRERARGERAFRRGADWLWRQQRKDGSWRSERHEDLATGHLLTALCLRHATDLPRDDFPFPRRDATRAIEWMIEHRSAKWTLGFSTDRPERPTWTNALAIQAFWRVRPQRTADHSSPMGWWLRRQQLGGDHPDRGAFCQGFWRRPPADAALVVDVRTTRLAVEALAALSAHGNDPAMQAARGWLAPRVTGGSAQDTADAVLGLVVAGATGDDLAPHVEVLRRMHADAEPTLGYLAAASSAFARVGGPDGWADALIRDVAGRQAEDGAWRVDAAGTLLDEPLVATSYALSALAQALRPEEAHAR